MGLRFALLNASFQSRVASRNFHRELDVPLTEFNVSEGALPDGFDFDAAVITGSGASVYWDDPWVDRLLEWTGEAYARGVPLFGICFGGQALADALGGRVEAQEARELGYHAIRQCDDSPIFAGVDTEFTSFVSHGDDVVELPLGARKLAQNEHALHGFRKGHAFGFLFHPEFDFPTAERITEKRLHYDQRTEDARESLTRENYEKSREAKRMFDNFEAYVRLRQ